GCHAGAGAEEVTPRDALGFGVGLAQGGETCLVLQLLGRRRRGEEFLVGADDGRDGADGVGLGVEVALAHPHRSVLAGGPRKSDGTGRLRETARRLSYACGGGTGAWQILGEGEPSGGVRPALKGGAIQSKPGEPG